MASSNNVVNITITKGSIQVPVESFGIGLILASFTDFTDRLRVYSSYAAVAVDVTTASVLAAAEAYFGQSVTPTQLILGRIESSDASPLAALQAVQAINNTWYALMVLDHTPAHVEAIAAYVQTLPQIYITSSQDPNVLTSATTDIASVLQAATTTRTAVLYNAAADTAWPECAWVGRMLPIDVGASTWKFKQLSNVVVDNLSQTQITFAQGKNCNVYIPIGGVSITAEGVMANGGFIDDQVNIDWLTATMQANVYGLLVNANKVPYTNQGIGTIENAVRQTLQDGVSNGALASDPAPTVSVPNVLNVSPADKADRTLNNVTFTATLAGAIHKINIQGYVSV